MSYHRIATVSVDPWDLAVKPAHFAEHLAVLRRIRSVFVLDEFVRRHIDGTLPDNAASVTFDDGYADNLTSGKPKLDAFEVPATLFVATGFVGQGNEFWWDKLARLLLIDWDGRDFSVHIAGRVEDVQIDPPVSERSQRLAVLKRLWTTLRRLRLEDIEVAMHEICGACAGSGYVAGTGCPMTLDEILRATSDGLISLGAHTATHRALGEIDIASARKEIIDSCAWCLRHYGVANAFAYPYGSENELVRSAVAEAGFKYGCSTVVGSVSPTADTRALPRLQIFDCDGDAFEAELYRH